MITKTKAIVLRNTNYGDHAIISKMYTREHGIRSYMINGARKARSKISVASVQPLSLLQLEAYEKSNSGIQRIKELKCQPLLLETYQDFRKRAVAMFMIELLNGCIVAEDCEYELFDFLERAILHLENSEAVSNFPLEFMVALSRQLGIEPQADDIKVRPYLDLETGIYSEVKTEHSASAEVSAVISAIQRGTEDNKHLSLSPELRKKALNTLVLYYQQHIMHSKRFHSTDILAEVMDAWHKV